MDFFLTIGAVIVLLFGFVVIFGAPYLPTQAKQIDTVFELAQLKPGQTIIDLGSGDGAVLLAAGKRGFKAVGYEINPILWLVSYLRTIRYRQNIKIHMISYWAVKLPKCEAVFVFLIAHQMERLDKKLKAEAKGVKLLSHAFQIPSKGHLTEKNGVFLYQY